MANSVITNRYDKAIIIILAVLVFGKLYIGFGALQIPRIVAILFSPMLFSKIKIKGYIAKFFYFSLFVVIYGVISLIWTPNPIRGIEECAYYVVHFLLFFEIIIFSKYANKPLDSLSIGWLLSLSITLLVALWEITSSNHLSNTIHGDLEYRQGDAIVMKQYAAVTFGNYNSYVTFICMALPFVFYIYFNNHRKKRSLYVIIIIVLILSVYVIIINSSRGGLLCVIIIMMIFFFNTSKKMIVFPVFITIACIVVLYYGENLFASISYKILNQGLFVDGTRYDLYKNGLKVFFDTLGLGVGFGGLNLWMSKFSHSITALHCMPLEILVQFGGLIFIIFITFMINLLFNSIKIKDHSRRVVSLMFFLTLPILSIIDSGYLLNTNFFAYISSIVIYINYEQIRPICKNIC